MCALRLELAMAAQEQKHDFQDPHAQSVLHHHYFIG
jgi:hypothetical protein